MPHLKRLFLLITIFCCTLLSKAQEQKPDTVSVGVYITSIHDIDFKQKEYTINLWIWLKYKNRDFDFINNLEIPQAKTFEKSFALIDSSEEKVFVQMKLQCVMKDSWKIGNFPFDQQKLRLSIENSQFDSRYLVFVPDTAGKHFDPRFTLSGWKIDSCIISSGIKKYETAFGDEELKKQHTEYSSFKIRLAIKRDATGLFWKMFLGMYIAFLISWICFFIHADSMDSRFGLSVGSLFAVIGNKYIIDSALPESSSFTLVDTLHGLTLFCILAVASATVYSLQLVKQNKNKESSRFDKLMAVLVLVFYVAMNIYFIVEATS